MAARDIRRTRRCSAVAAPRFVANPQRSLLGIRAMIVPGPLPRADSTLALFGGAPVRSSSLSPWPHFDEAEIDEVAEVLRSGKVNYWTGSECRAFEEEFATHCHVDFALSVANGTVALELALHALGIGPGDEVVVPPRTFLASASACCARCESRSSLTSIH